MLPVSLARRAPEFVAALLLVFAPLFHAAALGAEAPDPFAHPPELEPDVRFWIRVYTEVTTDQGLLHDDWNPRSGLRGAAFRSRRLAGAARTPGGGGKGALRGLAEALRGRLNGQSHAA